MTSVVIVESTRPLDTGGGVAWLRVDSGARTGEAAPRRVLTWRLGVLMAGVAVGCYPATTHRSVRPGERRPNPVRVPVTG